MSRENFIPLVSRELKQEIADRIRSLREKTGLSVRAYAAKIGMNYSEWSSYENGREPGIYKLHEICQKTRTPADWILFGRGNGSEEDKR